MHYKNAIAVVLTCAVCCQAWAINKCTDANGKLVYQDAPCGNASKSEIVTIRPSSRGTATPLPQAVSTQDGAATTNALTPVQKMEAQIADSQRSRKAQEYELVIVPRAHGAIFRQHKQCEQDMKDLQDKKALAKNNLAGATWEGSISGEMNAVATRCDAKERDLKEELETVKKECKALGGCK